ncbi:hypothetical protein [Salinarchaeum laminariae]|uniref:hypothetical protein n=1 Tax=Salinarchaeum laminariae TaxID=869888 RepID=UPI0020C015C4|nr:hypothetical protein [Salinarchaeum laminariae]
MNASENTIIVAALLAGVGSLAVLGIVEAAVGLPGQWATVVAFMLILSFGAIAPQLYLLSIDRSVSRSSRMGVVTLVSIVLATVFTEEVSGTEATVIWGTVGISIALIVVAEAREGYRQSTPHRNQ